MTDLDELATFIKAYELGAAWASSPEEAAAHIRDVMGYRSPSMVDETLAAAEARGAQRMIDALRDSQAYMEWVRVGQKAGTQPRRASWGVGDVMWAGDYLDSITKEGRQDAAKS